MLQLSTNSESIRFAGHTATVAFLIAILLQLFLATGIVPISSAWGGSFAVLTTELRIASVLSAAALTVMMMVMRRRAGLRKFRFSPKSISIASWVITAFLCMNTIGNFVSSSYFEQMFLGPLTLVLTIVCLIVSSSQFVEVT